MSLFSGPITIAVSLAYVGLLFFVAWTGDREGHRFFVGRRRAFVYSLSLAVYCTSWTYYGSVGLASQRGLDFLPIYIGPSSCSSSVAGSSSASRGWRATRI